MTKTIEPGSRWVYRGTEGVRREPLPMYEGKVATVAMRCGNGLLVVDFDDGGRAYVWPDELQPIERVQFVNEEEASDLPASEPSDSWDVAVTAAFLALGFRPDGVTGAAVSEHMGQVEQVQEIVRFAEEITAVEGALYQKLGDFPGVWAYEVVEPIGKHVRTYVLQHAGFPDRTAMAEQVLAYARGFLGQAHADLVSRVVGKVFEVRIGSIFKPDPLRDQSQAVQEGWLLAERDGRWRCRRTTTSKFETDADALLHVARMADDFGSEYHRRAIEVIGTLVDR